SEQPSLSAGAELATHGVASTHEPAPTSQSSTCKPIKCRFFTTKKGEYLMKSLSLTSQGCRSGSACPYMHDVSALESKQRQSGQQVESRTSADAPQSSTSGVDAGMQNLSIKETQPKDVPTTSKLAQLKRPISKTEQENPREFQINQLRRRFRPQEKTDYQGSTLTFGLVPSDPDFPFELDRLQCILHVPHSYPEKGRPTLAVRNPEMESAYQDNVARGFDDIVDFTLRTNNRGTLLNWVNTLDRQLERLLTTLERGPKLKFVANVGNGVVAKDFAGVSGNIQEQTPLSQPTGTGTSAVHAQNLRPQPAPHKHTAEEKARAEKRRATETKQIEARLGRLPLFQKRADGISFIIPIQPNKRDRLPISLQALKTVKLSVPQLYPLELSSIELQGVNSTEAKPVELGFGQWLEQNSQMNLVSQINYLASNMHNFAKTPVPEEPEIPPEIPFEPKPDVPPQLPAETGPAEDNEDRPHLHVIPRPPEWSVPDPNSNGESTGESSYEDDYSDEEEDAEDGGAPVPAIVDSAPGRGVALSFPFLELYGIELLELMNLFVTVKCVRCKESLDVKNVPQAKDQNDVAPKMETCKKCANPMSIGFQRQLMHAHANRAGYLDLDGCTIVDLLPSNFIPTCAECSTAHPAPGVSAVRGESAMAICRQCHRKMVFKIPEVKFLVVGTAAISSRGALPLKKPKEVLGIVAGQELPRRGRCSHYGKSYRWFRFSCCAKVFPCDKCHDAETDHPNEHANRMICGFCSREQIYRPENCGICRAVLIGKAGSGFWEGGKGTRNRALMSRKGMTPISYWSPLHYADR
ncbi:hypothetical protein NUU61_003009, partial [Penicillium alfredii]